MEIPRVPVELFARLAPPKFEVKPTKKHGEIFTFLCQPAKRPSVQALEIIRHVDASFYLKKSRWDYHKNPLFIGLSELRGRHFLCPQTVPECFHIRPP